MNREEAAEVVCNVLRDIQAGQNLECPPLDNAIKPIRDLQKFDSPMSLAATGMVGRKLSIKIPPKTNIFGDKNGLHTIDTTVDLLCKLAEEHKEEEPASV